jgi:tetratricopeptide (TPR) repeat protein
MELFSFLSSLESPSTIFFKVKVLATKLRSTATLCQARPIPSIGLDSATIGFLIICVLVIFAPLFDGGTTHFAVMVIRLLITALAGLGLYQIVQRGHCEPIIDRVGMPLILYLGLAVYSALSSPYRHQSFQWLVVLLSYGALLYLLVAFLTKWTHISILLGLLVFMGYVESAVSFAQLWRGNERPTGTFFNPNFLAGYLVSGWLVVLAFFCYLPISRLCRQKNRLRFCSILAQPLWALIGGIGLILAIIWTGSRGAVLSACAGAVVVVGLRFGRRGVAVLFLLLLLLAATPNSVRERFYTEHVSNPVAYARWQMWQGAFHMMVDHPTGVGLGLYQYFYPRYAFPVDQAIARYGKTAQTPHNEYLQMGVELGILSLAIFAWGLWVVAQHVKWILSQRLTRGQRSTVVGVAGTIVALLAHAGVDSNLHEPALAIVLVLSVGIIIISRRLLEQQNTSLAAENVLRVTPIWGWLGSTIILVAIIGIVRLGSAWIWYEKGEELHRKGNITDAMQFYRTAIVLDPGKALYHSVLAAAHCSLYEREQNPARAMDCLKELKQAIALNPVDGRLVGLLGQVYGRLTILDSRDQVEEHEQLLLGVSAYQQAVELEPFNAVYRFESGLRHMKLGEVEKAESLVKVAIEIEPNFLPGRAWLVKRYAQSGRVDLAEREYREVVERQQRYASWSKSSLEAQFLTVDVKELAAFLGTRRETA